MLEQAYANIGHWAIVACTDPVGTSKHVVGYILTHNKLSADHENLGEPYIGSELTALDLDRQEARNKRGRLIKLVGDPLPEGSVEDLPPDIRAMLRRAEAEWGLDNPTWVRIH